MQGDTLTLRFRGKGGKKIVKEFECPRLASALTLLLGLPGSRLFQYVDAEGAMREVRTQEVNAFLRDIAGVKISLKDFRTLPASANALERLAQVEPAKSQRARRRQTLEAIRMTADDLANTPTICRKSYVHETVVTAFEKGMLVEVSATLKNCRSPVRRAQVLAEIISVAA